MKIEKQEIDYYICVNCGNSLEVEQIDSETCFHCGEIHERLTVVLKQKDTQSFIDLANQKNKTIAELAIDYIEGVEETLEAADENHDVVEALKQLNFAKISLGGLNNAEKEQKKDVGKSIVEALRNIDENCVHEIYKSGSYFKCPHCSSSNFSTCRSDSTIQCGSCHKEMKREDYERDHLPDNMANYCRDCGKDLRDE